MHPSYGGHVGERGRSNHADSFGDRAGTLIQGSLAQARSVVRYRVMRKYAIAALGLALATVSTAAAQTASGPAPREATLTVTGDGTIERAPDLARLTVSIITNDDNPGVSSSENNERYNALKAKLAAIGIGADELHTYGYDVSFVPHPPRDLPPEQRQPRYGYITNRIVGITIVPIENAGKAIDAATAAGVTSVSGVSYDLKDRDSAYQAALVAAMGNARRTAVTLSSAGGFALGSLQHVGTGEAQTVRPLGQQPMFRAMAAAPVPTDVGSAGPITVTAHVTVIYLIR